jgi:hypothetical protein
MAIGGCAAVALSSCAYHGLAFRDDDRVTIVAPGDRETVDVPLTIRWTTHDLHPAGGTPTFALFVDQAPIRPGQNLRAIADDACRHRSGCPDAAYLSDHHVYVTTEQAVILDVLPPPTGQRTSGKNRHHATIVLLDSAGRRIGEQAYTVEFTQETT